MSLRTLFGAAVKSHGEDSDQALDDEAGRMLIAVCSAKHSPGATTLALALAAAPPAAGSLLVDADPIGGDLAVRLRGRTQLGLVGLLGKAHRGLTVDAVNEQCQWLAIGPALLAAPVDPAEADACLAALAPRLADLLPQVARRCVCDCGRMSPGSAAEPLVNAADVVVWVMTDDKAGLEHTRMRLHSMPAILPKSLAVLAGRPTRECDPAERESRLEIPIVGRIPVDADAVELLLTGSRRWERTTFGGEIGRLLQQIALSAVEVQAVDGAQQ